MFWKWMRKVLNIEHLAGPLIINEEGEDCLDWEDVEDGVVCGGRNIDCCLSSGLWWESFVCFNVYYLSNVARLG